MKKIDWYIIKKFLTTFFFSIFLFAVISVAIDVGEKTDDFVKSGWTFSQIVVDYYFAFIPHIIALLFPLFVFIAVIFFTSKLAGRSEIIAILASGVSFYRVLWPYFLSALFLAVTLWFSSRYLIPKAEVKRTYFEDVYVKGNSSYNALLAKSSNYYFRIDSFTYAGIHSYDKFLQTGGPFFMNRVKNNQVVYNLRAESMRWDTSKNKWQLSNTLERTINGLKEDVVMTTEKTMNFNFLPSDLSRDDYAKDKMTTPELNRYIKMEEIRGSEDVNSLKIERYRRDATPVSVIILSIIGAGIAARKVRGGSGMHLAVGFIIAAAFILMDRFSTIFSTKGNLPPVVASWIPNVIFLFVAIYILRKAPK